MRLLQALDMKEENKKPNPFNFELPQLDSQGIALILVGGVAIGSLSMALIALRLGPISRQARVWNSCVTTTVGFLSNVPGFKAAGDDGLEAMAVSLCNGSTPQKAEKPSS